MALIGLTKAPIKPMTAPIEPLAKALIKPPKMATIKPMTAPIKPLTKAPIKLTIAPIKPQTLIEITKAPIEPMMAPIKPTMAPIKPTTSTFELTCHSHSTSSKGVLLDIHLVIASGNSSMLHLFQQACPKGGAAFKHTPRPTQLKAAKLICANALAHTGTLTYADALA
jgi:hypothetical protein